jgi:Integrase zinc binding domain
VPSGAVELKTLLLRLSHDEHGLHLPAVDRTQRTLRQQAKVWWRDMAVDTQKYVDSCFKCQLVMSPHKKADVGTLVPTIAPYVGHTVYVDLKGPMPYDTGYILVFVDAVSRRVKLRYVPRATAKEVCEELFECFVSAGERPVVLRHDGGQPSESAAFKKFCEDEGVTSVVGVPYHSQGQGLVENRIRGVAEAIMKNLGGKAPKGWFKGQFLSRLEDAINSTYCKTIGMSPFMADRGREPRTRLSALCDISSQKYGGEALGLPGATLNDLNEVIAAHHEVLDAVAERALLATSLGQAITKRAWDAARKPADFKIGDYVVVHVAAPTRLHPWCEGPYQIVRVENEGNIVHARHFASKQIVGPFHVSRLYPFNMSRATPAEIADFQLEEGSAVVEQVLGHRVLSDGVREYHLKWFGNEKTFWTPSEGVSKVTLVREYCEQHGLPHKEPEVLRPTEPEVLKRTRVGRRKSRL